MFRRGDSFSHAHEDVSTMKISASSLIQISFTALILSACGGTVTPNAALTASTTTASTVVGASEPAARIVFSQQNFTNLTDFLTPITTNYTCLGDLLKTYSVKGADYSGNLTSFPLDASLDILEPTTRPAFLKNVSVDLTQTYYAETQSNVMKSDACSYRTSLNSPLPSSCADFDQSPASAPLPTVTPSPTLSPTPIPIVTPTSTPYFQTGYYHVSDDWCVNQGPISNGDSETSKAYVGGVNIDLDRTQLGANEDMLMMITYHALNSNASWPSISPNTAGFLPFAQPDAGLVHPYGTDESILTVSMVGTAQSLGDLMGMTQSRQSVYYQNPSYPVYQKEIATLEDPYGSLRTESIYIPLGANGLVDRIRIDRVRGSYHLYQIDLYRLGNRAN
jgi:hypothetical protein